MAAKARVYKELFAMLGLRELEQENARRQVVDVRQTKRDKTGGQLVSDDLRLLDE